MRNSKEKCEPANSSTWKIKVGALLLTFLLGVSSAWAGPTLSSADLVVVGRNTDLNDEFALVALADIPGNSIIFLTDEGWDDSGFTFTDSEDVFQWTVHSNGISAGTVIKFTNESDTTLEIMDSNHGTLIHAVGTRDMSLSGGDQLFIYQTSDDQYSGTIQRLDGSGGTEAGMIYAFNGDDCMANDGPLPSSYGWLEPGNAHTGSRSQVPDNMTALTTADGSGNANIANANGMLTQARPKGLIEGRDPWDYEYSYTPAGEYDNYLYDGPISSATKEEWLIRIHTVDNWLVGEDFEFVIDDFHPFTELEINAAPTISINNTNLLYRENDAAVQIDVAATASDADGDADWDGGKLVVQITANNEAGDQLSIPDNVVGTIRTSGTDLMNGATNIASLSASEGTVSNGTALTITFNSYATNALIQQVVRTIHYQSTSEDPGTSNRTITFTVTSRHRKTASGTRIITVEKVNNDAPVITTNNTLSLNEGASAAITSGSHLAATDIDDDDATITFTITSSPSNGQLENTDNTGVAITSFTQQNLTDGKIRYVHDDTNTTSDSFTFKVADGVPNELTEQTFNITINAVDDDAPAITTNRALELNEGATTAIGISALEANDTDSDNATLTFTVTSNPSNGLLENTDITGVAIASFTQQNLTDGKIRYVHDDSNTTSDSFTFIVADGVPNELTGQTFNITINAVDDDAPAITTNTALELNEGAIAAIGISILEANDTDSDNATLTYTVTSYPSNGQLENTDNTGVAIASFTQQNIVDGKIRYVHDDTNTTSDSFTFKVADGVPNELTGQTFNITINAIDDDAPTIATNTVLELNEGATAVIGISALKANDLDSDNATLIFTVTSSPSNGQLENTDNLGVAIISFTQQNLTDGKIRYVHDGTKTTSDSFTFKVADEGLNELTNQIFNISITLSTQIKLVEKKEQSILIYPNPATSVVFVETEMKLTGASLFAINGTKLTVEIVILEDRRLSFNVNNLQKGTYLLRLQTENGLFTEKVVVT